jgi:hypothetical protein
MVREYMNSDDVVAILEGVLAHGPEHEKSECQAL